MIKWDYFVETKITTLVNKASSHNGTLVNFGLMGSNSNFIKGECPIATVASIENNEALNQVVIGPNPTSDVLNIKHFENLSNITLKNNLGKIVLRSKPKASINVSSLSKGVLLYPSNR